MKRIILVAALLVISLAKSQAEIKEGMRPVQIMYVHGAQQYKLENKEIFINDITEIHKYILKYGKQSKIINRTLLLDGTTDFIKTPEYYYWGDQYGESIKNLDRQINSFHDYYYSVTGSARRQLVYPLHDLLWLDKPHHRTKIVNGLFEKVKTEIQEGNDVVLLGHSAGSVVVFNLALYHAPIINIYKILQESPKYNKIADIFKDNQYTCAQALLESHVTRIDEDGQLVGLLKNLELNDPTKVKQWQDEFYVENAPKILEYTKSRCLPNDRLVGLVTFGSPLIVSSSLGGDFENEQISRLVDYMVANGVAWLHMNHFKDFIGMPIATDTEMKRIFSESEEKITSSDRKGFVMNSPDIKRGANIITAHEWYLHNPKSFAKLLVKTYENGIKEYYPEIITEIKGRSSTSNKF